MHNRMNEPHGWKCPRVVLRNIKRATRQRDRALMMREYWQEQAALARELLELEMDYDDPFDSGYVYDAEMADYMEKEMEMENDSYSDYDDYYPEPDWDDWGDDYPRGCTCEQCRPDLYSRLYDPALAQRVTQTAMTLGELLRSKLQ